MALERINRERETGRFAPSPTGRLHLGNLRTALVAHDDIRERGGIFILRMEDTDTPRNVDGAAQSILEDLAWLGITWDEGPDIGGPAGPYDQSGRGAIYREALMHLARRGLIYECRCSRKDLQSQASAPHGPDGIVYPGLCRPADGEALMGSEAEHFIEEYLATPWERRQSCLRLHTDLLPAAEFLDEIAGRQVRELATESGDFVILRRDGLWAYQFVCGVDDALMGVTRVLRGEDLVTSAPRQAAIIEALGFRPPVYRHIPLVGDETGGRMSKRHESKSLDRLRERGMGADEAREYILSLTA